MLRLLPLLCALALAWPSPACAAPDVTAPPPGAQVDVDPARRDAALSAVAWRSAYYGATEHLPPGLARWNRWRVERALRQQVAASTGVLLVLLLLALSQRTRPTFEFGIKATHALPMMIQLGIYSWWAVWHLPVRWYAPLLLGQLVFGFLLDGLLGIVVSGRWRVGLAPAPVVLSAGLFAWFLAEGPWMSTVVISAALASKHLLRRDGRHIFNPSAFGLSVAALCYLALPESTRWHGVVWELDLAPGMVELILILALLAQTRVPVVLASMGALLGMLAWGQFAVVVADPLWAAPFLVIVLLLTDPATLPRTPAGRLLGGLTYALLLAPVTWFFVQTQGTDYWAKIVPVVLVNGLAPTLDRLGAHLPDRLSDLLAPARNRAHVALWFAVVAALLLLQRPGGGTFDLRRHAQYGTVGVQYDVDPDTPAARCKANPAWCRSFDLPAMLRARRGP